MIQILNNNVLYGEQRSKINSNFAELKETKVEYLSAGVSIDPVVSYNSSTNKIEVGTGTFNLYANDFFDGLIEEFFIATPTSFTPTPEVTNYLVVNYNSGSPIYQNITNVALINESNIIPVVTYCIHNNHAHALSWDQLGKGLPNKLHKRLVKTNRFQVESGVLIGETEGRIVNISSGKAWIGAAELAISAFSSAINEWNFYYHSAGSWVNTSATTTYNNTQYDNGTSLVSLNPNQYTVNWVYLCFSSTPAANYVLGEEAFGSFSDARNSQPRGDLPESFKSNSFLVGRIIVERNGATGTVESAFGREFTPTSFPSHNFLTGLDVGDFQHLTLLEHNNLTSATPTFNFVKYDPPQWTDLRAPATAINPPGNIASDPTFDLTNVGYLFEDAKTNTLAIVFQMDHSWKIGSTIRPHIHWLQEQDADVVWELQYQWTGNGQTPTSWITTTTTSQVFPYTSGSIGQISSFTEITPPASAGISSIFKCKMSRLGGNAADTYTGDVLFNEIDVHFQIDWIGSEQEFIKEVL